MTVDSRCQSLVTFNLHHPVPGRNARRAAAEDSRVPALALTPPPAWIAPRSCRHCRRRKATRPRGLCHKCHADGTVRDLYAVSASPSALRGTGLGNRTPTRTPDPTPARPGSLAKVEVLAERAALGLVLHHPLDGRV